MSKRTDSTDLRTRVVNWINGEGYPLEFRTAREFRRKRLPASLGDYVRHPKTGNVREVDILSRIRVRANSCALDISTIVECKFSRDKPWVVFTGKEPIAPSACIAQTISSDLGDAVMWVLSGDADLHKIPLFRSPGRSGHGGRRAFEGSGDVLYGTLQSVVTAARYYCDYGEIYGPGQFLPEYGRIAFPIVVIDAPLFECYLEDNADEVSLEEVDAIRLHWRGAESWPLHATVDVVRIEALPELLDQRRADLQMLAERAEVVLQALQLGFRDKTTKYLPWGRGSTGRGSRPYLITKLIGVEEESRRALPPDPPDTGG